jgi:hypothetical protein
LPRCKIDNKIPKNKKEKNKNFTNPLSKCVFPDFQLSGGKNSKDFNTALQSECGCKEATARETKFDSKRDKEEEEEETGDYIFACKLHLLHYQFLELLEVYEFALV